MGFVPSRAQIIALACFTDYCRPYPAYLKSFSHSTDEKSFPDASKNSWSLPTSRIFCFCNSDFNFENDNSIGFRSGLYGGNGSKVAPVSSTSFLAATLRWAGKLSQMTMSPFCNVGHKISRTYPSKRALRRKPLVLFLCGVLYTDLRHEFDSDEQRSLYAPQFVTEAPLLACWKILARSSDRTWRNEAKEAAARDGGSSNDGPNLSADL